jgi:zinc protease
LALLGLCAAVQAPAAWAIDIQEVTTPLGIKAWLVEDKSTPIVALSFSFAGGTASEPESHKGVTSLMATMLTDGAGSLPAEAFRLRQEDAATAMGFSASTDRLNGSVRMLASKRDEAFDLLRMAIREPRFDDEMLEQRRAQVLAGLDRAEQRPSSVAERTLMATLFAGHPYSHNAAGLRDTLKTLTRDDLKARASAVLVRHGLVISAVGDIDAVELSRQLDRTFGGLPEGAAPPALPDWTPPVGPRSVIVERPVPQSSILVAMPAVMREDPDWYPSLVLMHILGGGQQSRLFTEVREKRGLAYSVSAGLRTSVKASLLVISTASANEHVAEALHIIRGELGRMRADGVSDQELADAKTYLTGALALSLDSSGAVAGLLHSLQVDKLPRDALDHRAAEIAAVTAADVHRVARRLLGEDCITTIVVGKPQGLAAAQ